MKSRILPLAVLALMGALAATAEAQQAWNFARVMQAALNSHPLVLGRRSAQAAAQSEREGAEWQRYPSLSVEANTRSSGSNTAWPA